MGRPYWWKNHGISGVKCRRFRANPLPVKVGTKPELIVPWRAYGFHVGQIVIFRIFETWEWNKGVVEQTRPLRIKIIEKDIEVG
jgi:hypothetical protein